MRIYLDNCCFNRPFDDQQQIRVRIEGEAKLAIQDAVQTRKLELAWSYILDYENSLNPFEERRQAVERWRKFAVIDVVESQDLLAVAAELTERRIAAKDALHLACAIKAGF